MKYKGILFDMDDTLYNASFPFHESLKETLIVWNEKYPKDSYEDFEALFFKARSQLFLQYNMKIVAANRILCFKTMQHIKGDKEDWEFCMRLDDVHWDAFYKNVKPKDDLISTLKAIKDAGLKIGIITNFYLHTQVRRASLLGIFPYVDSFITAEEADVTKPNKSEVIMVGDDVKPDIDGGNALGIETVLIPNTYSDYSEEDLKKPKYHIKELKEVLKILGI